MNTEIRAADNIDLAGDMFQTIGLAVAAGIGVALVSGLLVLLIALAN
jgi:hypothetical protein